MEQRIANCREKETGPGQRGETDKLTGLLSTGLPLCLAGRQVPTTLSSGPRSADALCAQRWSLMSAAEAVLHPQPPPPRMVRPSKGLALQRLRPKRWFRTFLSSPSCHIASLHSLPLTSGCSRAIGLSLTWKVASQASSRGLEGGIHLCSFVSGPKFPSELEMEWVLQKPTWGYKIFF